MKKIDIGFFGMSHLGIVYSAVTSEKNFNVLGFDTNNNLIENFSHIEKGANSAAKSLDNYKVSHVLSVSIDPDPQEARNRVWPAVFFWVSTGFFNDPIAEMGIELPKLEKPEDASEELKTVLCDTFTINGTESQVLNRFHELKSEGLERAYVLAFGGGDSRENMMKLLAKDLLN